MEISVFIREYAPLAGEAGRAFRIDPVVILAQAAIETGWGESTLCREYHNFFKEIAYSPYISEVNGDNREAYRKLIVQLCRKISSQLSIVNQKGGQMPSLSSTVN